MSIKKIESSAILQKLFLANLVHLFFSMAIYVKKMTSKTQKKDFPLAEKSNIQYFLHRPF